MTVLTLVSPCLQGTLSNNTLSVRCQSSHYPRLPMVTSCQNLYRKSNSCESSNEAGIVFRASFFSATSLSLISRESRVYSCAHISWYEVCIVGQHHTFWNISYPMESFSYSSFLCSTSLHLFATIKIEKHRHAQSFFPADRRWHSHYFTHKSSPKCSLSQTKRFYITFICQISPQLQIWNILSIFLFSEYEVWKIPTKEPVSWKGQNGLVLF